MEGNDANVRLTKLESQMAQIITMFSKLLKEDNALAPLPVTENPMIIPAGLSVIGTKEEEVTEEILLVPRPILTKGSSCLMESKNHANSIKAEIHPDIPQEDDTLPPCSDENVPEVFQRPEFTKKYDGIGCPKTHINYFLGEMSDYVGDDSLRIHDFQYSLIGPALAWFMALDIRGIQEWEDLADQFLQQYRYNIKTTPTRMDLKHIEMRRNENFRSFAQRWRAKAAQVQPLLNEDELIGYFLTALPYKFFDRLYTSGCQSFSHLVDVGEKAEWAMRNDKFRNKEASKRPYNEAKAMNRGMSTMSQAPKPTKSNGKAPKSIEPKRKPSPKQFTPLPHPLSKLLPILLERQLVAKEPPRVNPPTNFPSYDKTHTCAYHMGEKGHSIDNCLILKRRVQALIDNGILELDELEPNLKRSSLFGLHGVNLIYGEERNGLDFSVDIPESRGIPIVASSYPEKVRGRE